MVAAWSALGVVFFAICKSKYRESFGSMVQLISDEDAATLLPEADERELDKVIDGAIDRVLHGWHKRVPRNRKFPVFHRKQRSVGLFCTPALRFFIIIPILPRIFAEECLL